MKSEHKLEPSNLALELTKIFSTFIVGDMRAMHQIETENFKRFLEDFVEKM
jgi:hypothetical protein